jgi:hypothetical protein
MKPALFSFGFIFMLAAAFNGQGSASKPIAVIELFTSEACSSCPPADKLIAGLADELSNSDSIFILTYHVDYWNRLGWKDSFSRHEYTERQAQYVSQLTLEQAYTPQVVVNGQYELVGGDEDQLDDAVNQALQTRSTAAFTKLTAQLSHNEITVNYQLNAKPDSSLLNFALISLKESTQVKAGENRGAKLNHANVVRQLIQTAPLESGKVTFKNLPGGVPGNFAVIAFVQRNDLKIVGAREVKLGNEQVRE